MAKVNGPLQIYNESVAERAALRAENARLREALQGLSELCDLVPIFQLDDGKSSVRAVRLAGKFVSATKKAHDALMAKKVSA